MAAILSHAAFLSGSSCVRLSSATCNNAELPCLKSYASPGSSHFAASHIAATRFCWASRLRRRGRSCSSFFPFSFSVKILQGSCVLGNLRATHFGIEHGLILWDRMPFDALLVFNLFTRSIIQACGLWVSL